MRGHEDCTTCITSTVLTESTGEDVPVFDIAAYYLPNDTQDLLVNDERFGNALAKTFLTPANNASTASITEPDHYLVLQRGHGFAVLGTSIPEAVYRAVYTTWNADVQASALTINHAAEVNHGVKYLTAQEVSGTLMMDNSDYSKEWPGKQTIELSFPVSAMLILNLLSMG